MVFQLPNFASKSEVKTAFWRLAKLYHPDTSSSEKHKDQFLEIKAAYDVLSDDERKNLYDETLRRQLEMPKKSYKIRADKNWIAEYKAQQAKEKKTNGVITMDTSAKSKTHILIICFCLIAAAFLLFLITHF
jgi:DnaJ-class molecular chaperone